MRLVLVVADVPVDGRDQPANRLEPVEVAWFVLEPPVAGRNETSRPGRCDASDQDLHLAIRQVYCEIFLQFAITPFIMLSSCGDMVILSSYHEYDLIRKIVMSSGSLSTKRLYEQLAERIRQQIIDGTLKAGDKLPTERQLGEDFGVSRTVVREAIKALKQEGLIEVKAGLGTFIVDATGEAFTQSFGLMMSLGLSGNSNDIVEMRELLEGEIAALAAQRATAENIEKMETAVAQMDEHIDDIDRYIKQDHAFHLALAEATQNAVIPHLISSIVDLLQNLRSQIAVVDGARERGQMHHKRIVQTIRDRDPSAAREAMQAHLGQVRQDSGLEKLD